jgi:hypothetical protein
MAPGLWAPAAGSLPLSSPVDTLLLLWCSASELCIIKDDQTLKKSISKPFFKQRRQNISIESQKPLQPFLN